MNDEWVVLPWGHLCAGVLQGSVLGQLLLLIHINDQSITIQSLDIECLLILISVSKLKTVNWLIP